MALSKDALRALYRKRAKAYDISANLYYVIGFREAKYRKKAVAELRLKPGNAAVAQIGCGTGLNFKYLLRFLGNSGRLIGVDLTDSILEKAAGRIDKKGWENIELVQNDAAEYIFPQDIDGVLSTFALTLVPEYENVIDKAAQALSNEGRMVLLDFKQPEKWPIWLVKLFVFITRPFGVTLDLADQKQDLVWINVTISPPSKGSSGDRLLCQYCGSR